jgi:hypothetical protein
MRERIARKRRRQGLSASGRFSILCTLVLLIAAMTLCLVVSPLLAQTAPAHKHNPKAKPTPSALPPEIKSQVPVYPPGPMPFHDGEQFVFEASWIGIPAASARLRLHANRKDPSIWVAEAWVQTNPFADLFFKMRDYVKEDIGKEDLAPRVMYIAQRENRRSDDYTITFDRPADRVTITKKNARGSTSREFIADNGWGMISGGIMALSQPLAVGKTYNFDVFSGTERYVFSFDVTEREHVHVPLGDFDAWRIVPDVLYWSDGNLKGEGRGTELWISADSRHLPLMIRSATFIGYVRADLIEVNDGASVMRAQPNAG